MEIHVAYNAQVEAQNIFKDGSAKSQKLQSEFYEKNSFFDTQIKSLQSQISEDSLDITCDAGKSDKKVDSEGKQMQILRKYLKINRRFPIEQKHRLLVLQKLQQVLYDI